MSQLSVDFFRLAVTKNFGRVTFLCIFSENFLQRKSLWIRGVREDQVLPSVFLCLTVSKHFVGELFCALFQNFWVPKKFMDKNERGIRFLSRKYFVSRHRKFSHGKLLLFHLIRVSRNLLFQRVMLQFSVKLFVSQYRKNLVGQPFCALFQKISGSKKSLWIRGVGEDQALPSGFFCLTVPK